MQFLHAFTQWLQQQSWLELTGVVTGLLCVYLAAINNIWNWPFAIISTGIYIFIFEKTALYADMGQNIYLFMINIYGWYYWSHRPGREQKVPVQQITRRQLIAFMLVLLIATPALGYTLVSLSPVLHYRPAAYPYLDSFCTASSLFAQVLMARKVLQNWLIWIFTDIIYTGVYLAKHLQPTAFMFGVYALIALKGYVDWRRDYRQQVV